MATSQKVQIDTYDYGASLTAPTLENPLTGDTITDGTAATCNEQTADSGVYIADYVGADASHLVPAGTYRLTTAVNGKPLKRWVTFTGVDGEVVYARTERTAELDSASVTAVRSGLALEATSQSIKVNTDNLPADPADQSAVEAAITAATSPLATPAQVNAQVVDALSVDTYAELTAPPAATSSLKDKITWLFMYARNKVTQTATQRKLYRDDGSTVAGTSGTTDDGTTFTKGEDA